MPSPRIPVGLEGSRDLFSNMQQNANAASSCTRLTSLQGARRLEMSDTTGYTLHVMLGSRRARAIALIIPFLYCAACRRRSQRRKRVLDLYAPRQPRTAHWLSIPVIKRGTPCRATRLTDAPISSGAAVPSIGDADCVRGSSYDVFVRGQVRRRRQGTTRGFAMVRGQHKVTSNRTLARPR